MQSLGFGTAARVAGLVMLLAASSASADTYVSYMDEATRTTSVSYGPPTAVGFQGNREVINVNIVNSADFQGPGRIGMEYLSVTLAAPKGEAWRRGLYTDVSCTGLALGRAAGVSVITNNPDCYDTDWNWGWISIRQLEFDASGAITKLDVMFLRRRGGPTTPGHIINIRHNAEPQSFSITTGRKSIFGPNQRTYLGDEADFKLSGSTNSASFVAEATKQQWGISVSAPDGQRLAKGRYITWTGDSSPTGWRMDVAFLPGFPYDSRARWCPVGSSGVLDVRDAEYDAAGQLIALNASFQNTCSSDRKSRFNAQTGVSGEIRFNR